AEPTTAAHLRIDPGPTAGRGDGRTENGQRQERLELSACGVSNAHAWIDSNQDDVAHREPRVDLGVHDRLGAVTGHAVLVGRSFEIELCLNHYRNVRDAALRQLEEQRGEEVVPYGIGRLGPTEQGSNRGRPRAPQRNLLQTDEIGLRGDDLGRESLRSN